MAFFADRSRVQGAHRDQGKARDLCRLNGSFYFGHHATRVSTIILYQYFVLRSIYCFDLLLNTRDDFFFRVFFLLGGIARRGDRPDVEIVSILLIGPTKGQST